MRRKLRSVFLRALLGTGVQRAARRMHEIRRRLMRRPHVVSAFLQLDDPYSYLLSCYLPSLRDHYDIDLRLYLSESRGGAYQPAPEMLAEYAVGDCERLARELAIPFLDKGHSPPVEHRRSMLDTIARSHKTPSFENELLQALEVFWRGDAEAAARRSAGAEIRGLSDPLIGDSRALQDSLGHYNSAMLHYAGEWYWGLDRLHYLALTVCEAETSWVLADTTLSRRRAGRFSRRCSRGCLRLRCPGRPTLGRFRSVDGLGPRHRAADGSPR